MWEEILKAALESGLWAVLFCVLLLYQLRDGRARESKYRETIASLIDKLNVLEEVRQGVDETLTVLRKREKKNKETAAVGEALRV